MNEAAGWQVIVESPGRINIIGEHTDYNQGYVLPTAIDKKILFKLKKNGSGKVCTVLSKDLNERFNFDLTKVKRSKQQWENYLLGVVHEIQELGGVLRGFDCELESSLPIGSGISSSAALECGLASGLNELFNLGLTKMQIVALSQRAEHNYVGTKCGIMDQFSSVMSKAGTVTLLDCRSLEFEYIPFKLENTKIVLINTNVSHNLASGEYNIRKEQCEKGVSVIKKSYPEVNSLRDVEPDMLEKCKAALSPIVYNRCLYVVSEKKRVLEAVESLRRSDIDRLGELMYETHEGLQHLYEVSCPELDFLVAEAKKYPCVTGARMMGGGFGGCTINLVKEAGSDQFFEEVKIAYKQKFNRNLTIFTVTPSEGTKVLTRD
ncbi:MAG: galactokinase [Flavobacteriaceae bacterium]|nr:galactokinase [Flavobacteriaceae bacterium]